MVKLSPAMVLGKCYSSERQMNIDPYATHLPILYLLSRFFDFEGVYEFGMGLNSTPVLCDRKIYSVKQVVLYEDSADWLVKVLPTIAPLQEGHIEMSLVTCHQMLEKYLRKHDAIYKFLTLVDNSDEPGRRYVIEGIVAVNHFGPSGAVTVFHDAEVYQDLLAKIRTDLFETFYFDALTPKTLVVFGYGGPASDHRRQKLNKFLEICRDFNTWLKACIDVGRHDIKLPEFTDKAAWIELLQSPGMYQQAIMEFK